MLRIMFQRFGEFCGCHPLEVVVTVVTVIMSLMSMGGSTQYTTDKVCGWNYLCAKEQQQKSSDVLALSIARCIALVYIYMQFRNLRRLGSKHVLGISGVFTIFSSFIFCIAFVKLFGNTLSGIHEALPFFLFLIDLSKASALAVFALSSTSRDEIHKNIGKGMSLFGPAITLDTIVEILAIGVGTLSGVPQLETMCSFGILSVVANYVAFMTFYPACLALVLDLSLDVSARDSVHQYKHLARELTEEHEQKPNPVTQRVKIIMSMGLAVVHIHSRFIAPSLVGGSSSLSEVHDQYQEPDMSFIQFYLYRMFAVHIDYGLTLLLGVVLLVKYIFVDRHVDLLEMKRTIRLQTSMSMVTMETQTEDIQEEEEEENIRTSFSIGDSDEEYETEGREVTSADQDTQTETLVSGLSPLKRLPSLVESRSLQECVALLKTETGVDEMTDAEIRLLVDNKHIPAYKLEGMLGDYERGVSVRRQLLSPHLTQLDDLELLPFANYDYAFVDGACCENVIGYTPVPVGVAGPLLLDGQQYMVPMATTEGCLVASTNRGCRALSQGDGVQSTVIGDGMSRGPAVRFPSARKASEVKVWLEREENYSRIKESFDATSRFARLQSLHVIQAGRLLYIRFVARTGDAMGMNMLSKGSERALQCLQEVFPDMEILSLSGNICTDKKPSAINWIEGRGKSVVCEALIPAHVIQSTLKTSVHALVDLNINKNLVGSAMAGSIGGYNAHAANIVTAMFIATGQDPAQCVASSNCITLMEASGPDNTDLYISCTMPSIEVGTVGGGTILPPQAACLKLLGVHGSRRDLPGENAQQLARIVCATVLAAELSLMSALAAGHLVKSHLKHNRSSISMESYQRTESSSSNITQPTLSNTSNTSTAKTVSNYPSTNSSVNTQNCELRRRSSALDDRLRGVIFKTSTPKSSSDPKINSNMKVPSNSLINSINRTKQRQVPPGGSAEGHVTVDTEDLGHCIQHVS